MVRTRSQSQEESQQQQTDAGAGAAAVAPPPPPSVPAFAAPHPQQPPSSPPPSTIGNASQQVPSISDAFSTPVSLGQSLRDVGLLGIILKKAVGSPGTPGTPSATFNTGGALKPGPLEVMLANRALASRPRGEPPFPSSLGLGPGIVTSVGLHQAAATVGISPPVDRHAASKVDTGNAHLDLLDDLDAPTSVQTSLKVAKFDAVLSKFALITLSDETPSLTDISRGIVNASSAVGPLIQGQCLTYWRFNGQQKFFKWLFQSKAPRPYFGGFKIDEDEHVRKCTLEALGLIQILRCAIKYGWEGCTINYTCSQLELFHALLSGTRFADESFESCLKEIKRLMEENEIKNLIISHGEGISNEAEIASAPIIRENPYFPQHAGSTPGPNGPRAQAVAGNRVKRRRTHTHDNNGEGSSSNPMP